MTGSDRHPSPPSGGAVAVVGMSGRFPGAGNADELWDNVTAGVESFTTFDDDELRAAGVAEDLIADPKYVRSRPVLEDIRGFDAAFFGLSPREAATIDPQQRLFTECAFEALESAGYGTADSRGVVGVYAGTNYGLYLTSRIAAMVQQGHDPEALMAGNDKDALATSVAYRLDLRGPSVAVQTFCSTSLVAVHLACASLRRGECEMAIAGGVSIRIPDRVGYLYQEGNQASPDGHVRTFDADACGSMFGDGVSVVALKPLERALADRDTVLAVVRGSAINNDGALKFSYHAPSIEGQQRCVEAALADAGVRSQDVSYVEAHGTATEVGDPMEVAALSAAFGSEPDRQNCLLGSIKPNVGHLDRASGGTGLIKVVQSLRHELIPGTKNYTTPNPEIDFAASPFLVTADNTAWPRVGDFPRIAGVSSLGMGGTNCHVIVSEAPDLPARTPSRRRWHALPVSARSEQGADLACTRLAEFLRHQPAAELADVAYTLQAGRARFAHRRLVVADSTSGAAELLEKPERVSRRADPTVGRRVTFLIAGVGEHYPGELADLYAEDAEVRADVARCLRVLGLDEVDELTDAFTPAESDPGSLAAQLGRVEVAAGAAAEPSMEQPAAFVAGYVLARHLQRSGVEPTRLLGYSVGEYVAACLSGVLTLEDALALVKRRAELIAAQPGGGMLAVIGSEGQVRSALGETIVGLDVGVRTAGQVVLSGPQGVIENAFDILRRQEIGARILATRHAYHSRLLAEAGADLTDWVERSITVHEPTIPYISNVTGESVTAELVADPAYWARHMCETVQFEAGLTRVLADEGDVLVEIGPGQSLGAMARSHAGCARDRWSLIVPTLPAAHEQTDGGQVLAEAIGRLWLAGVVVDWAALHSDWQPGRVPLPTYPWDRQEHWLEPSAQDGAQGSASASSEQGISALLDAVPKQDPDRWLTVQTWRQTPVPSPASDAPGDWVVLADGPTCEPFVERLRTVASAGGRRLTILRPGSAYAAGECDITVRPGVHADLLAALRHLGSSGNQVRKLVHLWSLAQHRDADPDVTARHCLDTHVALAQAAADIGLPAWDLEIVTAGTHAVQDGEVTDPARMVALGAARLVPVEYPSANARLIDLADPSDPTTLDTAVREIAASPTDQLVALRGRRRWIPRYDTLPDSAAEPTGPGFRRGGTYLVTGGLGGIGLAMAERIASDHDANVVLVGRTAVPPADHWDRLLAEQDTTPEVRRRLHGLRRLRDRGLQVLPVAADVARPEDMQRAVRAAVEAFGTIDGVLHCAGVPAVGLMQFKTPADMQRVLAPKVAGTLALADAVREIRPDFVLLFSSITSATGGGAGQVDYCAGNAFLDAFAQSDPLPGTHVISVDWCEWEYNGWTAGLERYDPGTRAYMEEYRTRFGLSFDEGWAALQRALGSGERHVVCCTQDINDMVRFSRESTIASHQSTVRELRDKDGRHPRPELSTVYIAPAGEQESKVAEVWCEALGLEEVGTIDNFFELGGNSLMGMEVISGVRAALEIDYLPPHLLYQAPTVSELVAAAIADEDKPETDRTEQQSRIDMRRSSLRMRRTA